MAKLAIFNSFDEYENKSSDEYEVVSLVFSNGWSNADLMTECKSYKTAIKRFFKALQGRPEFDGWEECMRESAENGCFKLNDFTMGNGSRNEHPMYAYEIEQIDEGLWYIFLNVNKN